MGIEESYQDATIVPPTAVGFIIRADGEAELVIPKDEDQNWHSAQIALAQLAIRFMNEPSWVQELADELKASAT